MSFDYRVPEYLIGTVTCDQCKGVEDFGSMKDFYDEVDAIHYYRARGWWIPEEGEEPQADLCPACAVKNGRDPASVEKLATEAEQNERWLNGHELYSCSELGIAPVDHQDQKKEHA